MITPRLSLDDEPNPADGRLLDRLVDGELSDSERRALLARLDAEPDGWRRCALAFLESQAWAEALGPSASSPAAGRPAVGGDQPGRARPAGGPRLRAFAATAAAVLSAFALGWGTRGARTGGPLAGAVATLSTAPAIDPCGRAASPTAPLTAGGPRLASAEVPPPPEPPNELEALPEPVVERWERQGYRVEHRQRVVPMELSDGRRLAVPVDEVRLRFVGDRTY